jgi:hypothetical protein
MGGFQQKQILGYQFQDHLLDKIRPYVDYVTKEQCLDLKPKVMAEPLRVKPTDEQKRVMTQLRTEFSMEDKDKEITVSTVLERMLRYPSHLRKTGSTKCNQSRARTRRWRQ